MRVLLAAPFPFPPGPMWGLLYLAAALRRAGIDVAITELLTGRDTPESLGERVGRERFDVVGLQVMTPERGHAAGYFAALRRRFPSLWLLAGGPHVTSVGTAALDDFPAVDFAFAGEAEHGLPRLLAKLGRGHRLAKGATLSDVPGLVFRRRGKAVANPPHAEPDLDSLGAPALDLFEFDRYLNGDLRQHGEHQFFMVMTARGCPYRCSYCTAPLLYGGTFRRHSAAYAADLLERAVRRGVRSFTLGDDNPAADRAGFVAFCDEIARRRLGVPWDASGNGMRLETIDAGVLSAMERAGCTWLATAIESGSDRILAHMGRGMTVAEVRRRMARLRDETGMILEGWFLIGYPEETDEDIIATLRLAFGLDIDRIAVSLFTPWPGTPITEAIRREGWLPALEYDQHWYQVASMPTRTVPLWRLRAYHMLAHSLFYLRPRTGVNAIRQVGPRWLAGSAVRMAARHLAPGARGFL